jgi:hypothetical protein
MIKLNNVYSNLQGLCPEWIKEWWDTFGINRSTMDPIIIRREFLAHAIPLNKVRDLEIMNEQQMLEILISCHFQWIVETKVVVQIISNQPTFNRKLFLKMWDTCKYP